MDGHFYTKDEETHWVTSQIFYFLTIFNFVFLLSLLLLLLMMLMLILLLVLLLSLFFFVLDGRTSPSLSFSHLGFPVLLQTHTSNSIYCVMQPVTNLQKSFSILSVHFLLYVRPCGRCLHTMGAFQLSAFVRSCQDNDWDWGMSLDYSMVADALHLVSSYFCLFFAINSNICQPVLLQC